MQSDDVDDDVDDDSEHQGQISSSTNLESIDHMLFTARCY
jgi:hypothetical protein